jgi:ABC-type proline/glycine betaine transport system permease subunit
MMLGIFALISPLLANIALLILMFLSLWLIVPLFFTPHGIFVRRQNAFLSIYSSLRMVRFTLPTSGLFVLSIFLLSRGLDLLWSVPENGSWLTLVGFAGHAFITTVLLAASFIYYRDMTDWLKAAYERFQQLGRRPNSTV